jgi:poly(3-hydroxybutyrate) depolymerase
MPNERDDVAFLDMLAEAVRDQFCVDRVAAFGFSNGSQMAQRWGCESSQVDAIMTVAGSLYVPPESCGVGVPIWMMAGENDPTLDMDGRGRNRKKKDRDTPEGLPDREARSFADNVALYLERNACRGTQPKVKRTGKTVCKTFDCDFEVTACDVETMGHKLPTERSEYGTNAPEDAWTWLGELPKSQRRR